MARRRQLEEVVSSTTVRRLLGAPPSPSASLEERLRYIRRCTVFPLPAFALIWIVVLGFGHSPTWLLIVMGAGTALALGNIVSISLRIRRAGAQKRDRSNLS